MSKRKTPSRKNPNAKRVQKAFAALKPKQRKFVAGVAEGKTKKQAALDAGYKPSVASNTRVIEGAGVRLAFQALIRAAVPAEKIAQRLAEGLDAMDTEFAKFEGSITDKQLVVAWAERRQHLELAAKMAGYYVEKQEVTVEDLRKSLESRSDAELDYYLEHHCWPEEAAAAAEASGA